MIRKAHFILFFIAFMACQAPQDTENSSSTNPAIGSILKVSPKLDAILADQVGFEIIAHGYAWVEGPVWVEAEQMLLFSDVPTNTIYKWTKEAGASKYLTPSGSSGFVENPSHEGSNGLILDQEGQLVLCQHGDRRLAKMEADLATPKPSFKTIAQQYEGKRFNSPNDVVLNSKGQYFFTDPPYGLAKKEYQELDFQGVYRVDTDSSVTLLSKTLSRPNGIALSPDESTLYVANSDPEKALWMAYDLDSLGNASNERVFYDVTDQVPKAPGLPDGLKVDNAGNLFATGPGGVWIFSPTGEHLGTIKIVGLPTANCAFNADKSELFLTSQNVVIKVSLKPKN